MSNFTTRKLPGAFLSVVPLVAILATLSSLNTSYRGNDDGIVYGGIQCGSYPQSPEKGNWGFINAKGEFIIKPQFDECSEFHNGTAIVKDHDKQVVRIWKDGQQSPINSKSSDYKSHRSINKDGADKFHADLHCESKRINGQDLYGYLDAQNRWAIPPQFYKAHKFSEGLAAVCKYDATRVAEFNRVMHEWKTNSRAQRP